MNDSQIALLEDAYKCLDKLTDEISWKSNEDGVSELWQAFEIIADLRMSAWNKKD